jgi:hypothetical protein
VQTTASAALYSRAGLATLSALAPKAKVHFHKIAKIRSTLTMRHLFHPRFALTKLCNASFTLSCPPSYSPLLFPPLIRHLVRS